MERCRKLCRNSGDCTVSGEVCSDVAGGKLCMPNEAEPRCGDGVLDPGEACDDGEDNSDTQPNACRTNCKKARCGDGVVDVKDECDEGSANSDTQVDACRTNCVKAWCGDGVLDTPDACDAGDSNSDTASNTCRTDCVKPRCGDGVQDTGEGCDDGAANSDTLEGACRTTCISADCGDGVQDLGEACDTGAANSNTVVNACRENCVEAWCGDGVQDGGEACDDGDANSDTVPNACREDCTVAFCGDGAIDDGEDCDDQNAEAGDGCDSCVFENFVLSSALPKTLGGFFDQGASMSLGVSYHKTTGQLTVLYVQEATNGDQLVAQQLPRQAQVSGAPLAVSNLQLTAADGGFFRGLSLAQDGDQIAVAYTHGYQSTAQGKDWFAQRSHIATSGDTGLTWKKNIARMDNFPGVTFPTTIACPLSSFASVSDSVFSALGFIDSKLSVITSQSRNYNTTCSAPPQAVQATHSSLSDDLGAAFLPLRKAMSFTGLLPRVNVWSAKANGKSVVGFASPRSTSIALQSVDGGSTWNVQKQFVYEAPALPAEPVYPSYFIQRFVSPHPGSLVLMDRRGIGMGSYAYGTADATWTPLIDIPSTDAEKAQTVKRVVASNGASILTTLWTQYQPKGLDTPGEAKLLRASSSNGGATFGGVSELLSMQGSDYLGLVEATMSPTNDVTALVCVGQGMKSIRRKIAFFSIYSFGYTVPCSGDSRLAVLRWKDGETPLLTNLKYITPVTTVSEARLVRDAQGRHTAIWADRSASTPGVFAQPL